MADYALTIKGDFKTEFSHEFHKLLMTKIKELIEESNGELNNSDVFITEFIFKGK